MISLAGNVGIVEAVVVVMMRMMLSQVVRLAVMTKTKLVASKDLQMQVPSNATRAFQV